VATSSSQMISSGRLRRLSAHQPSDALDSPAAEPPGFSNGVGPRVRPESAFLARLEELMNVLRGRVLEGRCQPAVQAAGHGDCLFGCGRVVAFDDKLTAFRSSARRGWTDEDAQTRSRPDRRRECVADDLEGRAALVALLLVLVLVLISASASAPIALVAPGRPRVWLERDPRDVEVAFADVADRQRPLGPPAEIDAPRNGPSR
jgi:hypothetical protein